LEGLARVRASTGRARQATRLFGAAAALRDEIGIPQSNTDHAYYEPLLTALRDELGDDAFDAAWSEGQSMSWQTAMDDLLGSSPATRQPATGEKFAATFGLTQRELEVLRLLAAGERTRAIGERLFISSATVATHIANIYGKLGVDSRAKATAFAHRHDL